MRGLLAAVLVVGAAGACGSGGGPGGRPTSASPTTTAVPPTTIWVGAPRAPDTGASGTSPAVTTATTSGGPAQARNAFRTPSGNIGCELVAAQVARCDIHDHAWVPPPKPADCNLDWGFGLQVATSGQAGFFCAGDTANDPSSPVLAYGQRARVGSFVCDSAEAGVTCTNEGSGRGFFLSRESYRIF